MESDELTEAIIGAAIEVHRILGPGLLESIYEAALLVEMSLRGLIVEKQQELDVNYKGCIIKGLKIDLLVNGQVVIELKSVSRLAEVATAQALSYLKAPGLKRALLINFGMPTLIAGVKRLSL